MDDEHSQAQARPEAPNTPAEPQAASQEPQAAPAPVDVTKTPEFQAAIERVFSERLGRERGKIRRELERESRASSPEPDQADQPEPQQQAAPEPQQQASRRSKMERRLDFRDAVADYGFSRAVRKRMETSFLYEGNDDADGWIADYVEVMGIGKTQPQPEPNPAPPQQQEASPQAQPPTPQGPPASDRGGPSPNGEQIRSTDPERWTQDHIARLSDEARDLKVSEARHVKNAFLAGLRGKTITFERK